MAQKECGTCLSEWTVAERILEETGSLDYYDAAIQAFADHEWLESFSHLRPEEIPLVTYLNARTVAGEIGKRNKQLQLQSEAASKTK